MPMWEDMTDAQKIEHDHQRFGQERQALVLRKERERQAMLFRLLPDVDDKAGWERLEALFKGTIDPSYGPRKAAEDEVEGGSAGT